MRHPSRLVLALLALVSTIPALAEAPGKSAATAPNVLVILTDDVGFGASSTFGGPIPTPAFDKLAVAGLRYNRFTTTGMCASTQAALLTGRNPGSSSPGASAWKGNGTIAEVLGANGYSTAWFGKRAGGGDEKTLPAGFEQFYGFRGEQANQWASELYDGTKPVTPAEQQGAAPAHLDKVLADRAIAWIKAQHAKAPAKPFFVLYTSGSTHAPHHAPKDWIAKFKGKFDQGWDKVREETLARQKRLGIAPPSTKLTPRPADVPAWDSLSADQKRVCARMMEVYAAALAHADFQIGRVIDAIGETGELKNTLVFYIQGDAGASASGTLQGAANALAVGNGAAESLPYLVTTIDKLGGPETYPEYPVGWALAMNAPFAGAKGIATYFGGTRNGMVVAWPAGIPAKAQDRKQFAHVVDVAPTIYEAAGIASPAVDGKSLIYSFFDGTAAEKHDTQYFDIDGTSAIYYDYWMGVFTPKRMPWQAGTPEAQLPVPRWEMYNEGEDFAQASNLGGWSREKLLGLRAVFDTEQGKFQRKDPPAAPGAMGSSFGFRAGMTRIPEASAPDLTNRSYRISADVEIPAGGASGVLATQGGRFAGWGLLVLDGKPVFVHAVSNRASDQSRIASPQALTPGKHQIGLDFTYAGGGAGKGGTAALSVDGKKVAEGKLARTVAAGFAPDETFDVGEDTGTPVIEDYAAKMPFRFTGTLEKLNVELK